MLKGGFFGMNGYDIVVKNGLVIDPYQGINEVMDVAVLDGVVVDLRRGMLPAQGMLSMLLGQ
jgi:formylmethanofuran dehydrogenase subunit A